MEAESSFESQAIEAAGGPSVVAARLGLSVQAVCNYRDGKRRLPVEYMPVIESMGGMKVRRWDLRPGDWHRIWPELVGAEGAPSVPAPHPADQGA